MAVHYGGKVHKCSLWALRLLCENHSDTRREATIRNPRALEESRRMLLHDSILHADYSRS